MPNEFGQRRAPQTERALGWIVSELTSFGVPFQLVGDLAAQAHGRHCALTAIELYVPGSRFDAVVRRVRPYVIAGPEHVVTGAWDRFVVALEFEGQRIEIGNSDEVRRFDRVSRSSGAWQHEFIDYKTSVRAEIFGVPVPVMPRDRLRETTERTDSFRNSPGAA